MMRPKGVPDSNDISPLVWLASPLDPRKSGLDRCVWLAIFVNLANIADVRRTARF